MIAAVERAGVVEAIGSGVTEWQRSRPDEPRR
jgi:hypothetical protein